MSTEAPKLYAALVRAQAAVRPVEKDSTNSFHKYKYASGDDVIASARAALNGAGLAVFATRWQVTETPVEWTDADGKVCKDIAIRLAVHFRAVHESGEAIDFEPFGVPVLPEKGRPIDKAEAGARTYALSYFLRDLLLIPRVDEGSDVDARDDRERDTRRPGAKAPAARNDDRQNAPTQVRAEAAPEPPASVPPAAPQRTAQQVCAAIVTQIREAAGQGYEGALRAEVTNLLNDTDPAKLDTETIKALLGTQAAPGPLRALRDRVLAGQWLAPSAPPAPEKPPATVHPISPACEALLATIRTSLDVIEADFPKFAEQARRIVHERPIESMPEAGLRAVKLALDAVYEKAVAA